MVTPVRNAEDWIEGTIRSILTQDEFSDSSEGSHTLTYVIKDAGSTDATVERAHIAIQRYATRHVTAQVVSATDSGMYAGLAHGFAEIENLGGADWYAYLNAGDLWGSTCASVVSRAASVPGIEWLMGLHAYFAPDGTVVHTRLPFRYRQDFLRKGVYGRGLPTVQQESTFWSSSLHQDIPWVEVARFATSGDAFMWWIMSQHQEPFIVEALLGGFRYHGNHLGTAKDLYETEVARFAGPLSVTTRAQIAPERALWEQPARLKARLNPRLLKFQTSLGGWANSPGSIHVV